MFALDALNPTLATTAMPAAGVIARTESGRDFADLLAGSGEQPDRLREAAAELVSVAFLMPLMKMARQDPFRSDLFHGGQGEETFGAQLDQEMASRMSQSMGGQLVDAVYRKFAARGREVSRG